MFETTNQVCIMYLLINMNMYYFMYDVCIMYVLCIVYLLNIPQKDRKIVNSHLLGDDRIPGKSHQWGIASPLGSSPSGYFMALCNLGKAKAKQRLNYYTTLFFVGELLWITHILWMGQRNPNHRLIGGKHPILIILFTWWLIPLSKWVITPVISGLTVTLLIPFITGVITHLLSGMSHQV